MRGGARHLARDRPRRLQHQRDTLRHRRAHRGRQAGQGAGRADYYHQVSVPFTHKTCPANSSVYIRSLM